MKIFDAVVIGKGLIGSAAFKYLAVAGKNVAVIGPDEPEDDGEAIVFASHYDQGRVQRSLGRDDVWTNLNIASIKQYGKIAEDSQIDFHHPAGCLYVNPKGADDYLENAELRAARFDIDYHYYQDGKALAEVFPDFSFPESSAGYFETSPSGYINPRLLIKAQLAIAKQSGGEVINETVITLNKADGIFTVKTANGGAYYAKEVIVTAGSFVNYLDLLPQKLDLQIKSEVVLLAGLDAEQVEELLQLPSLLYEIDNQETEGIYLIQPIKYPDGVYYLKMGTNMPEDRFFDHLEQVQEWFRNGDSDQYTGRLKAALNRIMPNLQPKSFLTKRCIINRSVHGRPYLGETSTQGLYLVSGCNGYSAMCSDAIGSLGADLITKAPLPQCYPRDAFQIIYK